MEQCGFSGAIFLRASTTNFRFEYSKSIPAMGSCRAQNRKSTYHNSNVTVFC